MLDIRRPEPKAALIWMAVWLVALIGLALVPMNGSNPEFAGMTDEIHYSSGADNGGYKAMSFEQKGKG